MNDIVLVVWNVLFEDRACGNDIVVFVWIVVDVAIEDFNWYVMIMIIMMILIWDDVVNKDHVNMNCYYWWICEYEMRLLLLLITSLRWDDIYVVNDMEIRFVDWCWKCIGMCMLCMFVGGTVHWPFRVFGTSFWPRSYVGCCVWSWGALCTDLPGSLALAFGHDHTSYEVYVMGGRVHWPCRMAQTWVTSVVRESKHFWGDA